MIKINFDKNFIKEFKLLPKDIKEKAIELESIFRKSPFAQSLHTKKLQGNLKSFLSFRITRDYRIIFTFSSKDEVDFIAVKHRKDIYR